MNTKDILREKIYEVIYKEGCIVSQDFSPDIIINKGKYEFNGIYAENLIFKSADAINLPIDYFAEYFPYGQYFESEPNSLLIPLVPFFLIAFIFVSIYRILKNIILLLLKRPTIQYEDPTPSLTAKQFADIMTDFLEKYQAGYQFKQD